MYINNLSSSSIYRGGIIDAEQLLIQQLIQNREIKWLCHFTPRENLADIKRFGLKTRDLLSFDNIVTDSSRYDQNRNAICLSVSRPNKWMFDVKRNQGFDLCLLLINPAILYEKNCLFFPHNAATASYRNKDRSEFSGEKALDALFDEVITYQKSGKEPQSIHRYWNNLQDCETTSDQAEVQCLENIEPEYIMHIIEDDIPLTYSEIERYLQVAEKRIINRQINPTFEETIKRDHSNIERGTRRIKFDMPNMFNAEINIEEAIAEVKKALPNGIARLDVSTLREQENLITDGACYNAIEESIKKQEQLEKARQEKQEKLERERKEKRERKRQERQKQKEQHEKFKREFSEQWDRIERERKERQEQEKLEREHREEQERKKQRELQEKLERERIEQESQEIKRAIESLKRTGKSQGVNNSSHKQSRKIQSNHSGYSSADDPCGCLVVILIVLFFMFMLG